MTNNNVYNATVRLPGGGQRKVSLMTDNWSHAVQLFEGQYGRGNVHDVYQAS